MLLVPIRCRSMDNGCYKPLIRNLVYFLGFVVVEVEVRAGFVDLSSIEWWGGMSCVRGGKVKVKAVLKSVQDS